MSYNMGTGPDGCLITWGLGLVSYNMRPGPVWSSNVLSRCLSCPKKAHKIVL